MSEIAIRAEGLSKLYQLGRRERYYTLRDSIAYSFTAPVRWFRNGRQPGADDKSSPTGCHQHYENRDSQSVWALKDVSFEVKQGEVVGVIGRNGAGKSTLLKILSRITEPTEGEVRIYGRVGSLLEVGTGFHPELTGRENIYLNGAILGMKKTEISSRFDEIVAFAEVEKFLDTPVKHYSSGMHMRLAFSVAAHLEPEILLVDEVLAVGDVAFQKKCLGKMGDVASEGRTILFVSHNMPAVARLCARTIWVNGGLMFADGSSGQVIHGYLEEGADIDCEVTLPPAPDRPMRLRRVAIKNHEGTLSGQVEMGRPFTIEVEYDINRFIAGAHVICFLYNMNGVNVLGTGDADCTPERLGRREPGRYYGEFQIPAFLLGEDRYSLTVSLGVPFVQVYDRHENTISFEVFDGTSVRRRWQHKRRPGILGVELPWVVNKLQ